MSGGDFQDPRDYKRFIKEESEKLAKLGMSIEDAMSITAMYGTNTKLITNGMNRILEDSSLPISIKLVLQYAIDYEMALTPADFFVRRTGSVFFDIDWVTKWKEGVIDYMARYMNWDEEEQKRYENELVRSIQESVITQ